jgi:flagellar hook assembly protein FlgD
MMQAQSAATDASVAPQTNDPAPGYLQLMLDLAVGQSVAGTGLKVTALNSQLDHPASASGQSVPISDSGKWHVQLQDTAGQALTLDGTLIYQIQGDAQNSSHGNMIINISGTLEGGGTKVDIDAAESGQEANGKSSATGNFDALLTKGGQSNHTTIHREASTVQTGTGIGRTVSSSYITRDGVKLGWTQISTVREYGHGEHEAWLQRVVDGPDASVGPMTINQHYFIRVAGDKVGQYLDRFDVQTADGTYALSAPAVIALGSDGTSSYSFELVNSNGESIKLNSPSAPQSYLNSSPMAQIGGKGNSGSLRSLASPLVSHPATGQPIMDLVSAQPPHSVADIINVDSVGRLPVLFAPTSSPCSTIANFVFGVALGLGLAALGSILVPELVAIGAAAEGATFLEVLGKVGEEVLEQGLQTIIDAIAKKLIKETNSHDVNKKADIEFWSNILQIMTSFLTGATPENLVGAFANGLQAVLGDDVGKAFCNADPYFVYPDIRPIADTMIPYPVQITRITAGLMDASTLTATIASSVITTAVLTPTGSEAISLTTGNVGGTSPPTYNDSPNPFVGGSLPQGATPIGAWTWDPTRPYGAMSSHTQPPSSGAQIHYFIHASTPLTLTESDNLIQYVYLDPKNPPSEVYLQFYTGDGNGEQRAYWGKDSVQTGGQAGTSTLYPMGPLPQPGGWVRLQASAASLGLAGKPINGVLYGAYGGQTWWGPTTTSDDQTDNAPDGMDVQAPLAPMTWTVGSQIAFRLDAAQQISAGIVDAQGAPVRTLLQNASAQAGYQVITWDAKNDAGTQVPDVPYRVQFSANGKVIAEHSVTISPLVADISTPSAFSLVRGPEVPIVGEAYGNMFDSYTLAYGEGLNPSTWITITTSMSPRVLPPASGPNQSNPSNLASWNTGLDEYAPWNQPGLSGVYTLRLSVLGKDGREADDTFPVVVGRLASTAQGGTITSPDGQASLTIPSFATQDSYSLMALVPLSQTESTGDWHSLLPADEQTVGQVYEVFPANERFRQPVTLQLPYSSTADPANIGIMMGDGTPGGWHYVGGQVDTVRHTISVQLSDFGGKRALVAPFVSSSFALPGPAGPSAHLPFTDTLAAPSVATGAGTGNSQVGFYSDLQAGAGEWASLDVNGTQLSRVTGADAGLPGDDAALKITKLAGGARMVSALTTPYDATKYPIISFDYRVSPGYAPNLLVKSNGTWWQFRVGTAGSAPATAHTRYVQTLSAPVLATDGSWHHYQFDVLNRLRAADPATKNFQIDAVAFGQLNGVAYLQYVPLDEGAPGDSYYLDNFAVLDPTNEASFNPTFATAGGSTFDAYSYTLDQKTDTTPPQTPIASASASTIKVDLPANATDGMWYLHVRGESTGGIWSETGLYPFLVDRQAPTLGRPDPPPGGVGAPDRITLPVQDYTGLDLPSVQLRFGGNIYSPGPGKGGLAYNPETRALEILYDALDPRPPLFADGQKVEVTIQGAQDYAGNSLAAPFTWDFTANSPKQINQPQFHQLTANGGEQPALSPDGATLAFVSSRSGEPQVWLMNGSDFGEKAGSAHPLLGNGDRANEAGPAWSPDGSILAYVSDAGGSEQIWTAGADGSGARALTTGEGGAASPTWLSDGKTVVFVRDGNLWRVASDGTSLLSMTNDPDKPVRSVQAQPGGNLLAVGYKLYQQTIKLYDPATKEWRDLTEGGAETEPAWLDYNTLLYTAPNAPQTQTTVQSAIWQAGLSSSLASVIDGSGVPGTADMEPNAANPLSGAQEIAIVSTRAGERNVWVRQDLRISRLEVQPSAGAPAGDVFTILYTLPTTSTVSMRVLDATGTQATSLIDGTSQSPGAQHATWDGKDANGNVLPPGDYVVELSATLPNGDTLTGRSDARVLDPASLGMLQIEIDQWPGQPVAQQLSSLHTSVFAQGNRTVPVAKDEGEDNQPHFNLTAGQYDVQVEYRGDYTMVQGVSLEGGKTAKTTVDLGLGGLEVSVLTAPGQPAAGSTYIQVSRSDDASNTALATEYEPVSDFVLAPGTYNVKVDYQGVDRQAYGVRVTTGKVTKQDIDLRSGLINLTVYEQDGKLVQGAAGQVAVTAYPVGDHTRGLGTEYNNPAQMRLPAGRYDLKVTYKTVDPSYEDSSLMGGSITNWINDVQVDSGQTVSQDYNLRLTPVTVTLEEAQGQPIIQTADVRKISFTIYPKGVYSDYVGVSYTNTLHLMLPEGQYEVLADYAGTTLGTSGPIGGAIDVRYGQSVDKTVDLSLGHLMVAVKDESGQPIDENTLSAYAYPVSTPDIAFASIYTTNPLDLPLRAGVQYNIEVRRSDGKHLILSGQQVKEGAVVQAEVNSKDFK